MKPSAIDIVALELRHVANTPRTTNGQGQKVEEAVQCRYCLQAWPCDVRQLLDRIYP